MPPDWLIKDELFAQQAECTRLQADIERLQQRLERIEMAAVPPVVSGKQLSQIIFLFWFFILENIV